MDIYNNIYDRDFFGIIDYDYIDDIQKEKIKGGLFNDINEFRRNANACEYVE